MPQNIYGGVAHFPQHPFADMHGLVRLVIRTRNRQTAKRALARYAIRLTDLDFEMGYWHQSLSIVERHATHGHSNRPVACYLALAYLRPDNYHPVPDIFLAAKKPKGKFELALAALKGKR